MPRFYHQDDRRRQAALERRWRPVWVAIGDMLAGLALAYLELGQRLGRPQLARRAGGLLVRAAGHYLEAGLGRRARAIGRLVERCRRAWLRHEAARGFA